MKARTLRSTAKGPDSDLVWMFAACVMSVILLGFLVNGLMNDEPTIRPEASDRSHADELQSDKAQKPAPAPGLRKREKSREIAA